MSARASIGRSIGRLRAGAVTPVPIALRGPIAAHPRDGTAGAADANLGPGGCGRLGECPGGTLAARTHRQAAAADPSVKQATMYGHHGCRGLRSGVGAAPSRDDGGEIELRLKM